jgi:hypothetical protein
MRAKAALLCVLAAAVVAQAAPPVVTVPAEVTGDVGSFVAVRASVTDAKIVKFVPVDAGLNVFPADLLADKTATVVTGSKPGKFRLICYSGNADGPSEPVTVTVVIGGGGPPVVDPVRPTPTPDVVKAEKVSVVLVEESQARTVAQGKAIADLRKWVDGNGHAMFVVDKDDPAASKNGYLPIVKKLPGVIVFDRNGGGTPLTVFDLDNDPVSKVKEVVK